MKIANWVLLLAACSAPGVLMGQDDAAPAQAEVGAAADTQADGGADAMQSKLDELDKQVAEFKEPSKSFAARYERNKKDVLTRIQKIKEARKKLDELKADYNLSLLRPVEFSILPEEKRNEYEDEGAAIVGEVLGLLKGKEPEQIAGVGKFARIYAEYQGIPDYPAALEQYKKVVDRLEKKWNAAKERLLKDRQKYTASARQKAEDTEQAAYKRQEQKMEKAGKNIEKDWFVPTSNMMVNAPILDLLLQRIREAKRIAASEPGAGAGKVPELLREYWAVVDESLQMLREGKMEQLMEKLNNVESYQAVLGVSQYCMPDKYRQAFRDQNSELRSELNKRQREHREYERSVQRSESAIERDLRQVESTLDRMMSDIDTEKDELARKAEEAAERAAEEEAKRLEEEEEAAAAAAAAKEDQNTDSKKSKKKGKKKSSKSGKKADNAED